MIWGYIAFFAIALVVGIALAPKPQVQPPAGLNEIQVPTAEDGREIPVLFGTRLVSGPNVIWYGDFGSDPIKKKSGGK